MPSVVLSDTSDSDVPIARKTSSTSSTVPLKRKLSLPKSSSAFLCPLRLRSSLTPHRRLRVPCHQRFRRWTDVGEGEDLSSPSRHPLLVLVTPLVVDSLFRTLPLLRYS